MSVYYSGGCQSIDADRHLVAVLPEDGDLDVRADPDRFAGPAGQYEHVSSAF